MKKFDYENLSRTLSRILIDMSIFGVFWLLYHFLGFEKTVIFMLFLIARLLEDS